MPTSMSIRPARMLATAFAAVIVTSCAPPVAQAAEIRLLSAAAMQTAQGPGAFGMTQISEIVHKPGAEYVGPFPAALQNYTGVTVGTPAGAKPSEAVRALIAFLHGPSATAAIRARGMEVE